jgi:transcriptional regulator with GAF, ATPase, and Fis domain
LRNIAVKDIVVKYSGDFIGRFPILLYKEVFMTIDNNIFFREATLRICGDLNIEEALFSLLQYLKTIIPADRILIQFFEQDLGVIRTIATATASGGHIVDYLTPLSSDAKNGRTKEKLGDMRGITIINKPELHPISPTMLKFHDLDISSVSIMHMPLWSQNKRLGSVVLITEERGVYSDEHAQRLSILMEPFSIAMSNALRHYDLQRLKNILDDDNRYLHQELKNISGDRIIGEDFGLKNIMEMVRQVASLDSPVLLLGETGVGKDVIANAIHYSSSRRNGPFINVNSGAIPETIMDSELFGHEKGAFTGAVVQKRGRFERAHKGTIFLDEIAELPLQAQVRMLRVLQSKEIERVGGTKSISVDIRIIAATHRDLEEMIKSGRFREDLWFRLNVFPIMIPPLRQRKEDIPALVHHFIECKSMDLKLSSSPRLARGAIDRLIAYDWPGNVRELENIVERALILDRKGPIDFNRLIMKQKSDKTSSLPDNAEEFPELDDMISLHIQRALSKTNGKIYGPKGAATLLGINPSTLRSKIKKLGIH